MPGLSKVGQAGWPVSTTDLPVVSMVLEFQQAFGGIDHLPAPPHTTFYNGDFEDGSQVFLLGGQTHLWL